MPHDNFPGFTGLFQAASKADSCVFFLVGVVALLLFTGLAVAFERGYGLYIMASVIAFMCAMHSASPKDGLDQMKHFFITIPSMN